MKNYNWFGCVALVATIVPVLAAKTGCPGNVASVPLRLVSSHLFIVSVSINHSGPYEFLLDTGTDTTVVGPSLAAELHLSTKETVPVSGAGFQGSASIAHLDLLQAGSHAVAGQEALVYGLMNLGSVDSHIRGILGEDFLEHFDMLIDNPHKLLCLDDSGVMRAEVKGSHTALVAANPTPDGSPSPKLLFISASLSDGTSPVLLKLDSGTNGPFLYNTSGHKASGGESVVGCGANGDEKIFSALPPQDVKIGSQKLTNVTFMTLAHPAKDSDRKEFDGLLSFDLFRRVFINHSEHFAVLEPR
jgi:hypothetical protein